MIEYETSTDDIISPWEKDAMEMSRNIKKLEDDYKKRQSTIQEEQERKDKLAEKKITIKEQKELKKKADDIKKLYALDYWMNCYNRVSYFNEIAGQALFHSAIGQALNLFRIELEDDSSIDWRLHFLWIQDSGSGKGRAINFVNRLFRHPNFVKRISTNNRQIRKYRTNKLGRMNATALINTFKLDKHGRPEIDDNGQEIVKLGVLEQNDFIFSEEGRALLEGSNESFELQEIFMTSMETIGSPNNIYTKSLTNYINTCRTRCTASFVFTTRPFGKIKQTLVESGLIQRFIFYPRQLDYDDRKSMNRASSFAFKTKGAKTAFREDFDRMIEELNKVVKFAFENKIAFDEEKIDELLSFLHEKMMWFTDDVENTVPNDTNRYILQSFVSRYKNNMVIMAFHSAAMRFSTKVEKQDLQYAFDYFKKLFEAQKTWISLSVLEDKDIKAEDLSMRGEIAKLLKEDLNQELTLPDLIKAMAKKFNKDYNAMRYHIIKFSKGGNPLIRILDDDNKRRQKVELMK